jgi:hypothetical protein
MTGLGGGAAASPAAGPLGDPVTESRRLVTGAAGEGLTVRLLGGVAVFMQAPAEGPLLPRRIGDIDLATRREGWRALANFLKTAGYAGDDMFNALHGTRRLLFYDHVNGRKLDVFVGAFSMCHAIPITDRLDRDPLTIPLAELLLTKLQIVELNERDQRDIYNLSFHHHVSDGDGSGIEADYIAGLCARDWGLWRTCRSTIERCLADLSQYPLPAEASQLIAERLTALWKRIEEAPKTTRWRVRSRLGDRVRWYGEPEEDTAANRR